MVPNKLFLNSLALIYLPSEIGSLLTTDLASKVKLIRNVEI